MPNVRGFSLGDYFPSLSLRFGQILLSPDFHLYSAALCFGLNEVFLLVQQDYRLLRNVTAE